MVWIIWGRRAYGRVAAHGGEHAHTAFFHLWYMPLFPTQSVWMCEPGRGFATRWNRRSILATYLRMWAPLVALGCLLSGVLPAMVVGAGLAAVSVGAWIARGVRDHRRSDFNLLAFGARCEPSLMVAEMRASVKQSLDARWAKLDLQRSPDEVAQYGARSLDEAVVAYGLLRLVGDAAADRILTGTYEAPPKGDGPYREDHAEPIPGSVIAQVEAAATALLTPHARRAASTAAWWTFSTPKLVLSSFFGLVALAGIVKLAPRLGPPTHVTAAQLAAGTLGDEYVEVDCDRIEVFGTFGHKSGAFACLIGDRTLPVVGRIDRLPENPIMGSLADLHTAGSLYDWNQYIEGDASVFEVYLVERSMLSVRAIVIVCIAYELLFATLIGFWIVRRFRRRPSL